MKYRVRFLPLYTPWRWQPNANFLGKGWLHLQETGLIVDGQIPRVRLPLIDYVYQAILSAPCTRTIPYAAITLHRPGRPWGLWLAVAVVVLIGSLVLGALAAGFLREGGLAIGTALAIALAASTLALLVSKPTYSIRFRNACGRMGRLRFGIPTRPQRRLLAEDLEKHIAAVRTLIGTRTSPATSRRAERAALTIPPPPTQRRTATERCVDALQHAGTWGSAAVLACLVAHALFSSMPSSWTAATTPLAAQAEGLFYGSGRQLHAFVRGVTPNTAPTVSQWLRADGATITTVSLWSAAGCLAGIFFALSRVDASDSHTKIVRRLVRWLPVLAGLALMGWFAYCYARTTTGNEVSRAEGSAAHPDDGPRRSVVHIELDTTRLQAWQLTADDVRQALVRHDVELAAGRHDPGRQSLVIRSLGRLETADQLADLIVADGNGHPVYLRDLGRIESRREALPETLSAVARTDLGQHFDKLHRPEAARAHYDEAVRLFAADTGQRNSREAVICYNDSAANLLLLSRWGEAHAQADAAMTILEQSPPLADTEALKEVSRRTKTVAVQFALSRLGNWGWVLLLATVIAGSAGRRGFSPWLWLAVTAGSRFPLANLPVLAALPDPRLEQRRRELRQLLIQNYRGFTPSPPDRRSGEGSVGDQTTR